MKQRILAAVLVGVASPGADAADPVWRVNAVETADGLAVQINYSSLNRPFLYALGLPQSRDQGTDIPLPLRRAVRRPAALLAERPIYLEPTGDGQFRYRCCRAPELDYVLYLFSARESIPGLDRARIELGSGVDVTENGRRRLRLRGGTQYHGALFLDGPALPSRSSRRTAMAVDEVGCEGGRAVELCAYRLTLDN